MNVIHPSLEPHFNPHSPDVITRDGPDVISVRQHNFERGNETIWLVKKTTKLKAIFDRPDIFKVRQTLKTSLYTNLKLEGLQHDFRVLLFFYMSLYAANVKNNLLIGPFFLSRIIVFYVLYQRAVPTIQFLLCVSSRLDRYLQQ